MKTILIKWLMRIFRSGPEPTPQNSCELLTPNEAWINAYKRFCEDQICCKCGKPAKDRNGEDWVREDFCMDCFKKYGYVESDIVERARGAGL